MEDNNVENLAYSIGFSNLIGCILQFLLELIILGVNFFPKAYAILILRDSGRISSITFYQARGQEEIAIIVT